MNIKYPSLKGERKSAAASELRSALPILFWDVILWLL
jgi:hypothetical protein